LERKKTKTEIRTSSAGTEVNGDLNRKIIRDADYVICIVASRLEKCRQMTDGIVISLPEVMGKYGKSPYNYLEPLLGIIQGD